MGTLHVALQDGFSGDDVAVRVDGDEVLRKRVQTRWQIGLAEAFDVDVDPGRCRIEIDVPTRSASTALDVDVADETWVGVSLNADGGVETRVSAEPFGYA